MTSQSIGGIFGGSSFSNNHQYPQMPNLIQKLKHRIKDTAIHLASLGLAGAIFGFFIYPEVGDPLPYRLGTTLGGAAAVIVFIGASSTAFTLLGIKKMKWFDWLFFVLVCIYVRAG